MKSRLKGVSAIARPMRVAKRVLNHRMSARSGTTAVLCWGIAKRARVFAHAAGVLAKFQAVHWIQRSHSSAAARAQVFGARSGLCEWAAAAPARAARVPDRAEGPGRR